MSADAGLFRRDGAMRADGNPTQAALNTAHDHIDLAPAWPNAKAEAFEFVVPNA